MGCVTLAPVKTTVEIPDELYQGLRVMIAEQHTTFRSVVEDMLRRVLAEHRTGAATAVTIDDDVREAVLMLAERSGEGAGTVLSRLARTALERREAGGGYRNGVKLLPVRPDAPGATLEEVNLLRDELP